ncbi:MAG: hypothetical protein V1723_01735 [Candidatus Uhrbacteria bacterium]
MPTHGGWTAHIPYKSARSLNFVGSYAEVRCQKIARRFLKGIIYHRKGGSLRGSEFRFVCYDEKVHLTILHDDEVFHEDTLLAVLPCDGSCVRGEVEIPQEFHAAISNLFETGESFRADGKRHPVIRVSKRSIGA